MNKIPLDSLCLVRLGSWVDDTLACCCFSTFGVGWGVAGKLSDNIARGCWAKGVGGVLVARLFCILFCSRGVALSVILCYLVINHQNLKTYWFCHPQNHQGHQGHQGWELV